MTIEWGTQNEWRFRVYCKSPFGCFPLWCRYALRQHLPRRNLVKTSLCRDEWRNFNFCRIISLYRSIVRPGGLIFPVMLLFTSNVPINVLHVLHYGLKAEWQCPVDCWIVQFASGFGLAWIFTSVCPPHGSWRPDTMVELATRVWSTRRLLGA